MSDALDTALATISALAQEGITPARACVVCEQPYAVTHTQQDDDTWRCEACQADLRRRRSQTLAFLEQLWVVWPRGKWLLGDPDVPYQATSVTRRGEVWTVTSYDSYWRVRCCEGDRELVRVKIVADRRGLDRLRRMLEGE